MSAKTIALLKAELGIKEQELIEAKAARTKILGGGQEFSISNGDDKRQLRHVGFGDLEVYIANLEEEIRELKKAIANGGYPSNAVCIGWRWS